MTKIEITNIERHNQDLMQISISIIKTITYLAGTTYNKFQSSKNRQESHTITEEIPGKSITFFLGNEAYIEFRKDKNFRNKILNEIINNEEKNNQR